MKSGWRPLLLALCVGLLCSTAWAADDSGAATYNLGEMVVTGDKPGVKDMAITNDITAEQIKATNAKTVAEALQYVPGIVVTTGVKNQPNISMHGFDSSKILILIDGIPYYETNYGKLDLNKIPSSVVSKIEVIKGAPSVLYGANAEAGVINIITKQGTEKPWAEANVGFGENNTYIAEASHGAQIGVFNYWLSYSRQHTDGWRMSDDYEEREASIKTWTDITSKKPTSKENTVIEDGGFRDNSAYTTDTLWTRVGLVPNEDSQYFATFHYIASDYEMPANVDEVKIFNYGDEAPDNFSKGFGKDEDDIDWGVDLSAKQKVNDIITLKGKLFYHNHQDIYVSYEDPDDYDDEIAHSKYKDYMAGGSLITDLDLLEWYTARFSLHYRGDSHKERPSETSDYYDAFSYTGSVGMENEFRPIEGLTCILGASYDWFEVTESDFLDDAGDEIDDPDTMDELNPMLGLSYEFKDTTKIYGSVARKTRFPTLQYLYSGKSYNPELESEHSINYTVGISRTFFDFIDASVEGFYSDISDWISRDYNEDGLDGDGQYQNEADVVFSGAEINLKAYPIENLTLSLGYTYTLAKNKSDDAVTEHMVNIPKNKVDMGVGYLFPVIATKLDLRGLYIGECYADVPIEEGDDPEEKLGDHFILNGRVSKQFLEHFEGYVEVNNIFDKDYYSEESFPGRGRSFMVGLSAKI